MIENDKKLGIVLSGGGAGAFANLGVLDELAKAKIPLAVIAGTGMGAIIGCLYALGYTIEEIIKIGGEISKRKIFSLKMLNLLYESMVKADRLEKFLEDYFGEKTFSNCQIPFTTTAVNIESGEQIILNQGLLVPALKAASAIPFLVPPVFLNDLLLVDGGITNNIPVNLLKPYTPHLTLAIQLNNFTSRKHISAMIFNCFMAPKLNFFKSKNIFSRLRNSMSLTVDIVMRSLQISADKATKSQLKQNPPDFLILPHIEIDLFDFERIEEAIHLGRTSIQSEIPQIRTKLDLG